MAHLHSLFQIVSNTAFETSNHIVHLLTEDEYANICEEVKREAFIRRGFDERKVEI
jgi:hypothetical protein